jgi:hypothetical protein
MVVSRGRRELGGDGFLGGDGGAFVAVEGALKNSGQRGLPLWKPLAAAASQAGPARSAAPPASQLGPVAPLSLELTLPDLGHSENRC